MPFYIARICRQEKVIYYCNLSYIKQIQLPEYTHSPLVLSQLPIHVHVCIPKNELFSVNACWHYYAQPIHCTCVTTLLRDDSMILLRKDGVSLDTTYCNRKFNVFLTIFKFADGMALCIPCDIRGAKNSPKTLFQIRPKRKKTNSS